MKIKALKGFKDILPEEAKRWQQLEELIRELLKQFNFTEIRLPIIEETSLFARAIGDTTDIVEKEMFTFPDKQQTLRPEGTASLIRAVLEHALLLQKPVQRLFTIGAMFRRERPQKGRLRQFHQLDIEVLGSESAFVDAELMALADRLFARLGIDVSLELNSLGCPKCRPVYRKELLQFINTCKDSLCKDCQRRSESNPLRVLDCKVPACRGQIDAAPSIQEYLCEECAEHFQSVQNALHNLNIDFRLNKFMVRGLDYYCRTTFEFITNNLGAQAAVAAGGRYDGLIETLGGKAGTPGAGFAMGLERIVLLLEQQEQKEGAEEQAEADIDLFIAGLGEAGQERAFVLSQELRSMGSRIGLDYEGRSLKAQMKLADKERAAFVLIIGDAELESGKGVLKNMLGEIGGGGKEQEEIVLEAEAIRRIIGQ